MLHSVFVYIFLKYIYFDFLLFTPALSLLRKNIFPCVAIKILLFSFVCKELGSCYSSPKSEKLNRLRSTVVLKPLKEVRTQGVSLPPRMERQKDKSGEPRLVGAASLAGTTAEASDGVGEPEL